MTRREAIQNEKREAACPHCGKRAAFTWARDWSSDGKTQYLGHVCQADQGGCGKHFDTQHSESLVIAG